MFEMHCFGLKVLLRPFYFIYLLGSIFNVCIVLYLYYCYNCFRGDKVGYKTLLNWFFITVSFNWQDLNAWELL